jgi:hypothetical protein
MLKIIDIVLQNSKNLAEFAGNFLQIKNNSKQLKISIDKQLV